MMRRSELFNAPATVSKGVKIRRLRVGVSAEVRFGPVGNEQDAPIADLLAVTRYRVSSPKSDSGRRWLTDGVSQENSYALSVK